ncbi:MAG: glycosyltransferase family 2 protein [Hyphomicrobiaceae bacterium]|nr:glycosyltransferase family 2 protein [Hyphomicrobiaceae bacterium]
MTASSPSDAVPDVSVIMSTFNEERWLRETIDAMLAQTGVTLEILVIDDGSRDESTALLQSFADPRLVVLRNETRAGWRNNMNTLAGMARGRLIKPHCPDDVVRPGCFKAAVDLFDRQQDVGFLFCDFGWIDAEGRDVAGRTLRDWPERIGRELADDLAMTEGCFINTSCLFVPRDRWHGVGGMRSVVEPNPERWPTVEDFDLMARLQEHHDVGYVRQALVGVRTHAQQVQGNVVVKPLLVRADLVVIGDLLARLASRGGEHATAVRNKCLARVAGDYLRPAVKLLLQGRWRQGVDLLAAVNAFVALPRLMPVFISSIVVPAIGRKLGTARRRLLARFASGGARASP